MIKRHSLLLLALAVLRCGGRDGGTERGLNLTGGLLQAAQLQGVKTWSFIPIPGMTCANGSATGIGINLASLPSDGLLIYLEGGGGCWSAATCKDPFHIENANLNGFDATTLQEMMVTGSSRYNPAIPPNHGTRGLWDRSSAANPFKNYHYVYVPYCTADFHAGNLSRSPTDGLSHTGYVNMTRALAHLAGMFPPSSTARVVLSGASAGGFGALWNFPQTQAAFGNIPVPLVAESGPPLPPPYLATSLEEAWRQAWGLDETKPATAPSTHLFPYLQWMAQAYPSRNLAFIEMTGDVVGALFLGVSLFGPYSLSNGLFDLRQQSQQTSQDVRFFLIPSLLHGYLHQDPATWPAPGPPYGSNKLPLSTWIDLQLKSTPLPD